MIYSEYDRLLSTLPLFESDNYDDDFFDDMDDETNDNEQEELSAEELYTGIETADEKYPNEIVFQLNGIRRSKKPQKNIARLKRFYDLLKYTIEQFNDIGEMM